MRWLITSRRLTCKSTSSSSALYPLFSFVTPLLSLRPTDVALLALQIEADGSFVASSTWSAREALIRRDQRQQELDEKEHKLELDRIMHVRYFF